MSIVTLTINNKNFKIACSAKNEKRLKEVATKLDIEVQNVAKNNPKANFELLILLTALKLVDEKLSKHEATAGDILLETKKDFEQQMHNIMQELKHVADKIDYK